MRVAIVFDTHTGTTAAAAEKMAEVVRHAGHECSVESVSNADPKKVAAAGAIAIGCWTKGYFIIMQHPSEPALKFVDKLSLNGKPVAVFTTYKLAIGSTLQQLSDEGRVGRRQGHRHVQGQGSQGAPGLRGLGAFARQRRCSSR